jgi:hypothetical protein
MKQLVFAAVCLLSTSGCLTTSGRWNAEGFEERTYGWKARYARGKTTLLGRDWRLDNWRSEGGTLVAKDGPGYVATLQEDENRDGTIGADEQRQAFIYDLKFVNTRNNGVIWVQTRTMHPQDAEKDLGVLLGDYADSLAGTGFYEQGSVFGLSTVRARSFTTFIGDRKEIRLGPHQALSASIEIAPTDRLRIAPGERSAKLRVVLTKFYFLESVENSSGPLGGVGDRVPQAPIVREGNQPWRKQTAIMLVGYFNDMAHFDAGAQDFDGFATRLEWPIPHPVETVPLEIAPPTAAPPAATPPTAAPPAPAPAPEDAPRTQAQNRRGYSPTSTRS